MTKIDEMIERAKADGVSTLSAFISYLYYVGEMDLFLLIQDRKEVRLYCSGAFRASQPIE